MESEDFDWNDYFGQEMNDVMPKISPIDEESGELKIGNKFEYSDSIYFKFLDEGYELCFSKVPDSGAAVLAHVTLYNSEIETFSQYKEKLPHNITWKGTEAIPMNNTAIIRRFGDTYVKGGGTVNVFLNYPELGVGFTFLNRSWHDNENPLIHITVCRPAKLKRAPKCCICLEEAKDLTCPNCPTVRYCSETCKKNFEAVHICDF
ncbi:unnamed protein product [Moneuplotes crassus]|uniref:MYND-type domain-containing protein n=1 Tax=Euplotes crassus TaxID=5936 RepID=A0AAD1XV96_EUPCR|nr:unnamed protein product [Moneuplotes crassus]